MASPMNAMPRSTTYVPTTAHTSPTIAEATSARTKKPSVSGSRIRSISRCPSRSWKCRSPGAASSWWWASSRMTRPALEDQQVAAVGAGEDVGVEHDVRRPVGDDRPVDGQHLLEPLGGAGEVVGGRDDRLAPLRLGLEEVHQELLGRRVDPGDRLVEQEQVRLRGERAGEEHPPPLAAGQAADLRPQVALHADLRQGVDDRPPIVATRPADRPEAREAAHHHDVLDGDRERPVDHARPAGRRPPAGPRGRPGAPRISSRPDHGCEQPGHQLEERALAGPVGPDDREQAAGLDRDRHVLERDPLAVARGDVAQPDVRVRVGVGRIQLGSCRWPCGSLAGARGRRRHVRHSIN